jgi:hypothetical protein
MTTQQNKPISDKRLLISYDIFEYTPQMIRESKEKNSGKIIVRGILQKADTLNQNGRVYPMTILEREVRNYQKLISERRAVGELDHPEESTVSLKNSSHLITSTQWDGNTLIGEVEILNTPSGLILQSLIESNIKLGISSRGVGSVEKKGDYHVVQDDFQLICWDFVSEPSTTGAFMLPEGVRIRENSVQSRLTRVEGALDTVLVMRGKK